VYSRLLKPPKAKSFFLFGPRGTGKSAWVRAAFPKAIYLDLLEAEVFNALSADPQRLEDRIPPGFGDWVVLDEVQRIPELLNEVHRLIERRKLKFAMTGSSARKLRRQGVNLLAGRALTLSMHPLTVPELGRDFDLGHSLRLGNLPGSYVEEDPGRYLQAYVKTYLKEEILQEGLARNLGAFSRFLEAASFSQAATLNISSVAREAHVSRKAVEDYFTILEDLLVADRIPVFAKKAKRELAVHSKFMFFDTGIFRALRPRGPLDSEEGLGGQSLETLVYQELKARNAYGELGYGIHYWRSRAGSEVDFVLYGERGLRAIEVKRASRVRSEDLSSLKEFLSDYPVAKAYMVYGGNRRAREAGIELIPATTFFTEAIDEIL
jgi:predicted AAA+ superfamily ATPase